MIRVFALAVFLAAPLASAQLAPATRAAVPTTRPSPEELHAQAYQLMRQEKFDMATPLLNRAYNETAAKQRTRPLILNRALLDLVQKGNLPRAINDISQHFARNSAPDEEASNLLGSLLQLAADNPRWRDGPIYADGFREFARREAVLERHRTGYKRWGTKWITQAEFDEIKRKDKELVEQIDAQGRVVSRLTMTVTTLTDQYNIAATRARGFANHIHVGINPTSCALCAEMAEAGRNATEISADLHVASGELKRATTTYQRLQRRTAKPTWPTRYPPIDPDAPPPKPPEHPALTALAATAPAAAANAQDA
ncbi:MAG: hypothetical protein QOF78_807, partial [Phycisphaerales bacterium]|nr:hypothetical protein [Phycisphaerales bacterium]